MFCERANEGHFESVMTVHLDAGKAVRDTGASRHNGGPVEGPS